ncbi:MAG: NADH-quinone oxidoreductase subunit M, partial [Actinobacteria bacterium]|nr:NADH-quinone oxidoreductase subunit M [Actinomycetota bacterium]
MLSAVIFVPLAAAVAVALLPAGRARLVRWTAVGATVAPLVLLVWAWFLYDPGPGFDLVESVDWIPTLGVGYAVGVDGVSLPLASLTALLFFAATVYPVDRRGRDKQYYATVLFLEFA